MAASSSDGGEKYFTPNLKSKVWRFFKLNHEEPNKSYCNICNEIFQYNKGNTSVMSRHMERKHSEIYNKEISKSTSTSSELSAGQVSLTSFLDSKKKFDLKHPKALEITGQIALMIAKDQQPYSIVEDDGFRGLLKYLEPRYQPVSRKFMAKTVIPLLYKHVEHDLKGIIAASDAYSFTADSWTSCNNDNYLTVTVHLLDKSWNLSSFILNTQAIDSTHTSENLARQIKEILTSWLPEDSLYSETSRSEDSGDLLCHGLLPTMTTDNARNIVKGLHFVDRLS